ncbi:MAG: hypothetical protein EOM91_08410 [Sphingobacteriia bacterium]|nr:hypothetical protein [Sphingobacteriia bacterium]NCC39242.1 hypothetical protein [Gammaproteobacteria bacterium]
MPDTTRTMILTSAATLALLLAQGPLVAQEVAQETDTPPAAAAQPAPAAEPAAAPAPAQTQSPAEAARAKADERRAAMMAERDKRYEELRASAAELGLDLPAAPPWTAADWSMPPMPEPPAYHGHSSQEMDAMREQHRTMREQMRSMSPEERRLMREAYWRQVQADAAERGIEMPESPPWPEADLRRKEMEEQYEKYRQTIDQMTKEQIEAARALFGNLPQMPEPPAMPPFGQGYGQGPWGGRPSVEGYGYPSDPRGLREAPSMTYPNMPRYEQGPPPPYGSGYGSGY